VLVKVKNR